MFKNFALNTKDVISCLVHKSVIIELVELDLQQNHFHRILLQGKYC